MTDRKSPPKDADLRAKKDYWRKRKPLKPVKIPEALEDAPYQLEDKGD